MNNAKAIEARELTKRFGDLTAVDRIDFQVEIGEFFGFLGPNGAGKTTTINMLTGLARATSGELTVMGHRYPDSLNRAQEVMGVVPDESNLYEELSGLENLVFSASLYGLRRRESEPRARELLSLVGLEEAGDRRFKGYSRGMKRKLTIAAALMHKPRLLFLDEPTSGIDVASARHIRRLLAQLNEEGTTVFLTTHYIEEAERLTSRIAFIVEGRIARCDYTENLLREAGDHSWVSLTLSRSSQEAASWMADNRPELEVKPGGDGSLRVKLPHQEELWPVLQVLHEGGFGIYEAKILRPSLEDVFVRVTGIEADELRREGRGRHS